MTLAPHFSTDKGIVEDLIFYLVADNDPEQYVVAYDRLAAWVDNSLDIYQVGLYVTVLYTSQQIRCLCHA